VLISGVRCQFRRSLTGRFTPLIAQDLAMKTPKLSKIQAAPKADEVAKLLEEFNIIARPEQRSELIDLAERYAEKKPNAAGQLSDFLGLPLLEQVKRFRDKAAEAEQLVSLAESAIRRQTLAQIARLYHRTADQLEGLDKRPRKNTDA
jgi:antitoxin component of MazEF toxin-antitoxin module